MASSKNQGEAEVQPDGRYKVTHADGTEELLTEGQFHAQYDVEGEPKTKGDKDSGEDERRRAVEDEGRETPPKKVRPDTHDADDAFTESKDFGLEYADEVEEALKKTEEHIKAVRAELKSLKGTKPEERDFGAVRQAMHDLAHTSSLLRTAHVATVPHDGPERLRPAPSPEDNISSGPSEESNMDKAAVRHFGR